MLTLSIILNISMSNVKHPMKVFYTDKFDLIASISFPACVLPLIYINLLFSYSKFKTLTISNNNFDCNAHT